MSGHGASHGSEHGGHGHSGGEGALGKYLKPFANPFKSGKGRAGVLNANESSSPWNVARSAEAAKEMSPEIGTTISLVKESIAKVILGIKTAVKMPLKITNEIVTNVAALPVNLGRWALDLLRFPPRMLVIGTDMLAEKTFGKASQAVSNIRKGIHHQIDKIDTLNFADLFSSSGGHGGGHGHAAAAHH